MPQSQDPYAIPLTTEQRDTLSSIRFALHGSEIRGDFNHPGNDGQPQRNEDNLRNTQFTDGEYKLPPELRAAALAEGQNVIIKAKAAGVDLAALLQSYGLNEHSDVTIKPEKVAALLLADSSPLSSSTPDHVSSQFKNRFAIDGDYQNMPSNAVALEGLVAKQIYIENFAPKPLDTPKERQEFLNNVKRLGGAPQVR